MKLEIGYCRKHVHTHNMMPKWSSMSDEDRSV